jgi:hypothetical protein
MSNKIKTQNMKRNKIITSIQLFMMIVSMGGLIAALLFATEGKHYALATIFGMLCCFYTVLLQQFKK